MIEEDTKQLEVKKKSPKIKISLVLFFGLMIVYYGHLMQSVYCRLKPVTLNAVKELD